MGNASKDQLEGSSLDPFSAPPPMANNDASGSDPQLSVDEPSWFHIFGSLPSHPRHRKQLLHFSLCSTVLLLAILCFAVWLRLHQLRPDMEAFCDKTALLLKRRFTTGSALLNALPLQLFEWDDDGSSAPSSSTTSLSTLFPGPQATFESRACAFNNWFNSLYGSGSGSDFHSINVGIRVDRSRRAAWESAYGMNITCPLVDCSAINKTMATTFMPQVFSTIPSSSKCAGLNMIEDQFHSPFSFVALKNGNASTGIVWPSPTKRLDCAADEVTLNSVLPIFRRNSTYIDPASSRCEPSFASSFSAAVAQSCSAFNCSLCNSARIPLVGVAVIRISVHDWVAYSVSALPDSYFRLTFTDLGDSPSLSVTSTAQFVFYTNPSLSYQSTFASAYEQKSIVNLPGRRLLLQCTPYVPYLVQMSTTLVVGLALLLITIATLMGLTLRYHHHVLQRHQAALDQRERFLQFLSHEVKNPLQAIIGLADVLQEHVPIEQQTLLGTIQNSSEFVASLLNQTLRLTRLAAQHHDSRHVTLNSTLEFRAFDLWRLLRDAIALHGPQAQRRGLRLELRASNAPCEKLPLIVWGDSTKFRQLLHNLIHNAIKFTDQGSVVLQLTIVKIETLDRWTRHELRRRIKKEQDRKPEADEDEDDEFEFRSPRVVPTDGGGSSIFRQTTSLLQNSSPNSMLSLQVSVIDTGVGMSSEQLSSLFQDFAASKLSITRPRGGHGLGLGITREIVDMCGGRIEAFSELNHGSRFEVHLDLPARLNAAHSPFNNRLHENESNISMHSRIEPCGENFIQPNSMSMPPSSVSLQRFFPPSDVSSPSSSSSVSTSTFPSSDPSQLSSPVQPSSVSPSSSTESDPISSPSNCSSPSTNIEMVHMHKKSLSNPLSIQPFDAGGLDAGDGQISLEVFESPVGSTLTQNTRASFSSEPPPSSLLAPHQSPTISNLHQQYLNSSDVAARSEPPFINLPPHTRVVISVCPENAIDSPQNGRRLHRISSDDRDSPLKESNPNRRFSPSLSSRASQYSASPSPAPGSNGRYLTTAIPSQPSQSPRLSASPQSTIRLSSFSKSSGGHSTSQFSTPSLRNGPSPSINPSYTLTHASMSKDLRECNTSGTFVPPKFGVLNRLRLSDEASLKVLDNMRGVNHGRLMARPTVTTKSIERSDSLSSLGQSPTPSSAAISVTGASLSSSPEPLYTQIIPPPVHPVPAALANGPQSSSVLIPAIAENLSVFSGPAIEFTPKPSTGIQLTSAKQTSQPPAGTNCSPPSVDSAPLATTYPESHASSTSIPEPQIAVQSSPAPPSMAVQSPLQDKFILVTDDDEFNRRLIARMLSQLGATVSVAQHGAEAVEAVDTQRFDAIIMDIMMPVMDGHVATERIRALGHSMPIIALSGNTLDQDISKAREVGCTTFCKKPISKQSLARLLQLALAGKLAFDASGIL